MTQEISGPRSPSGPIPPSETQEMDDKFQFLLCEQCKEDVESPKLLFCLHNLCTECTEEYKPIGLCPICGTPHSQNAGTPTQDNLLYGNLQAKLRIYRKVIDGQDLICDSCKKEKAAFWCSDCKEFLCISCFDCHQRFLKRESHEAKSVKDLRAESSKDFLAGFKKLSVMSCSDHNNQPLSLYCTECRKPMCCICVLLDNKHVGQHCEIQKEIQCRHRELQGMNTELKKKKINYLDTWRSLQDLVKKKEKVKNETRLLIQQKIEMIVRLVQEKGEKLLTAVEEKHNRNTQTITEKIQCVKGMVRRMGSSERLVENMHLYASDQELMDMHLFIRESLEELKSKEPPLVDLQVRAENYTEVKAQLQALFERVTGEKEAAPAVLEKASQQNCSVNSPAKRKYVQLEKAIQTPPKIIKTEPDDNEGKTSPRQASCSWLDQPGTSSASVQREGATGGGLEKISETSDSDGLSLDSCTEEESSDEEPLDDSLLEDIVKTESDLKEATMCSVRTPVMLSPGQGTLVFFDLKMLPGNILHLVAVGDNSNCFSVMIQLMYIGNATSNLCDIGLDSFLHYLQSLHRPILVGYNLWNMDFPVLVAALEAIKKEERFVASICGFLDALPLIKEKIPDAPSYTLKNLEQTYFWGELDDTQAEGCAKTLRDLWTVLDVNLVMERHPVIAYSSLQCYTSLQPLLKEKFLSRPSAQTLALHKVNFSKLQAVYRKNPKSGLRRLCRYLNANLRNTEKKIKNLSKIRSYFLSLPHQQLGRGHLQQPAEPCS